MQDEKARRRHLRTFAFFLWLLSPLIKWIFNLEVEDCRDIEGPYLVLANHNLNLDPLLVGVAMHHQMYYVASEHIFRAGIASRLLERYFAPIPRTKGSVESGAAMAILRHLRKGHNVCIFAEGNRSFNGLTREIHPSTAKLVRSAGSRIVTLRLEGGYFTSPRWSAKPRRGKMKIVRVGVYEPQDIRKMSLEEIDAMLHRDLFEDAYARQAENPIRDKGSRLAEYLESTLFACPVCGRIGTLTSRGSEFVCECGMHAVYTETGMLQHAPYDTITEWDAWQREALEKQMQNAGPSEPICADPQTVLSHFGAKHQELERFEGNLTLYADRMEIAEHVFPFAHLTGLSVYGRNHLVFSVAGEHWEISGSKRFSALKYEYAYEWSKNQAKTETTSEK